MFCFKWNEIKTFFFSVNLFVSDYELICKLTSWLWFAESIKAKTFERSLTRNWILNLGNGCRHYQRDAKAKANLHQRFQKKNRFHFDADKAKYLISFSSFPFIFLSFSLSFFLSFYLSLFLSFYLSFLSFRNMPKIETSALIFSVECLDWYSGSRLIWSRTKLSIGLCDQLDEVSNPS